jgi:ABC-type lipoprotein export system ATPase subunit
MRINNLQLYNFKFFTNEDNTLHIGGKNVLIWGENGSGKSSIYWAIYTILQCSFKNADGIDAYFTDGHDKNLLNIHKEAADDAFIEMSMDNGNTYKIKLGDHTVVGNTDLQLSAVSSDFIDYKVVASFLNFWHKDEPNVYPVFEEQILRFMPFKSPVPFTDEYFDGALKTIMKGPPQDATSKKYSTKGAPAFDQYVKLVDEFNRQFTEEIGLVNVRANKLLQDPNVFGYDIEIELVYEPLSYRFNGARTEIRFVQPKVVLHIRNYYGIPDAVKRPQSFLNEAKKTAIGLAIRLALLERRLAADKLSLLALDDLLISLDMSNRDVVLNLLFDEYQKNYQIILFSHDKQFFQIAKHKIDHSTFKSDWLFWEFYINEKDPKKPLPKLFLSQSQLSIAYNHLLENDYPAAANYLRKHCEELLEDYLPEYCYANVEKQEPYTNHSLDSVISQSIDFLDRINQTIAKAELVKLKQYVKILLNPLSHTERGVQRHKTEIKSVIKILEDLESELKKIKYSKPILEKGETIFLNLTKNAKTNYQISFTLTQDLFVYDNGGGVDISKCKISSDRIKEYENGNEIEDKQFNYYPKLDIADAYKGITNHKDFAMPQIGDWHKLFTFGDGAALTTKMVLT